MKALDLLRSTSTSRYVPVVLNNLGSLSNPPGECEQAETLEMAITLDKLTELYRKTKREEEADLMAAKARDIRFEMEFVVRAGSLR